MDANTTVTGDSNFKHLANALRKRGRDEAAAYVEGLAHGANRSLTARECWASIRTSAMASEILLFLQEVVDDFPEECKRALYAAQYNAGMARILTECADPFAACEDSTTFVLEFSKAELRYFKDLVGSRPSDEGHAQALYDAVKAALEEK